MTGAGQGIVSAVLPPFSKRSLVLSLMFNAGTALAEANRMGNVA